MPYDDERDDYYPSAKEESDADDEEFRRNRLGIQETLTDGVVSANDLVFLTDVPGITPCKIWALAVTLADETYTDVRGNEYTLVTQNDIDAATDQLELDAERAQLEAQNTPAVRCHYCATPISGTPTHTIDDLVFGTCPVCTECGEQERRVKAMVRHQMNTISNSVFNRQ